MKCNFFDIAVCTMLRNSQTICSIRCEKNADDICNERTVERNIYVSSALLFGGNKVRYANITLSQFNQPPLR